MKQHDIARADGDVLAFQGALDVGLRDLVAACKHWLTLERGNVDQHAARDERADVLDAKLRQPFCLGEFAARFPL
jgi:hypothetical protein